MLYLLVIRTHSKLRAVVQNLPLPSLHRQHLPERPTSPMTPPGRGGAQAGGAPAAPSVIFLLRVHSTARTPSFFSTQLGQLPPQPSEVSGKLQTQKMGCRDWGPGLSASPALLLHRHPPLSPFIQHCLYLSSSVLLCQAFTQEHSGDQLRARWGTGGQRDREKCREAQSRALAWRNVGDKRPCPWWEAVLMGQCQGIFSGSLEEHCAKGSPEASWARLEPRGMAGEEDPFPQGTGLARNPACPVLGAMGESEDESC